MAVRVSAAIVIALLLPVGSTLGDGDTAAKQIKSALDSGRLDQALNTWETEKSTILDSLDASFAAGEAFIYFAGKPEVMRYRDIPEECAKISTECIEAIDSGLPEGALNDRLRLSRLMLKTCDILRKRGKGGEAEKLEDKARAHLEAITKAEGAEVGSFLALGEIHVRLIQREPPKAEEHIRIATELYTKAKELGGDSTTLCLAEGNLQIQLAELKTEQLLKAPRDRKIKKAIPAAYEAALRCFQRGLELNEKSPELKTAYNECLWLLLHETGGKSKCKPMLKDYKSRYRKILIRLPDSRFWHITEGAKLKEDYVFQAVKYNPKAAKALVLMISEYSWDTNYINRETNETIGGDNIGGLARRSDRDVRAYFQDIKERMPLRKARLKRIPKVQGYSVKGMTKEGDLYEWKTFFFKHSKVQKTFELTIIADLGMLDKNPYELRCILDEIALSKKKR